MGKVLIIKDADFSQNKLDTVVPFEDIVLDKEDFTILDGVFFGASNNVVAKNPSVKLSEGYYLITGACTITITANSNFIAHVMLLSSIKSVENYSNNESLPVVNNQSKVISKGTTDTLTATGRCYLCIAEYNTIDRYSWPNKVKYRPK